MLSGVLGLPKSQVLIFMELNVLRPLASIFIKENAFYSDYQFPIPITIYCSIFLLPVVDGVQYNDESLLLISFPGLHTNPSQEQGHLQGFREAPMNNYSDIAIFFFFGGGSLRLPGWFGALI